MNDGNEQSDQAVKAVQVTPKAIAHVKRTMAKEGLDDHCLRMRVVTGGCSGYEYSLEFVREGEDSDHVVEAGDLRVFIAADSLDKIEGTVLDYVDGLYGAGLRFSNPHAAHSCGCGTSFSTE